MSFYQSIAPYYHHVFKVNVLQTDFVTSKLPNKDATIVDVGCGIGTLSFELINFYNNIIGIDMDAEMIRVALEKNNSNAIQFQELSMLKLTSLFENNTVDGVVCFGNTLVHLNSLDEIAGFLQQSKAILKPNGKLLMQIVNYDRILSKNVKNLPTIDNDEIIFERNYVYHKSENKIDFNTRLTVKATNQIIENSIELIPVLQDDLLQLLNKTGFENSNFYGNFKQDLFTIDSPALIVEAW